MVTWRTPRGREVRDGAKVAFAAVAAYGLTLGERADYAFFSVLGAALVMGGSVGENLGSSLNRVKGTVAGALVGITAAFALGMSAWSLGIAVAALAWLTVGLGWGASATRIGIAMALVVLFAHTADAAQYGGWRVANTLIGVAIGLAVSRLVWPIRGHDEIVRAIDDVLAASAAALDVLRSGGMPDALRPLQERVFDAL